MQVKTRLDDDVSEYGEELADLVKVITDDDWSESNMMKLKEYCKYLSDIAENDEMLFFNGDRFIPEKRLRAKILMKAHGMYVGMTRMKARIKETFWWPGWWKMLTSSSEDPVNVRWKRKLRRRFLTPLLPIKLSRNP